MKLSIIIINYNTPEMTARSLRALQAASAHIGHEVILIDNNSEKKLDAEAIRELRAAHYIENAENLGFAAAVNQGLELARGEYIFLLNSDVIVDSDTVQKALRYLDSHPQTGLAGLRLIYPDGKTQASCGRFPTLIREIWRFSMIAKILPVGTLIYPQALNRRFFLSDQPVDWVSGGALFIRRSLLDQIGILDPGYFFGLEDWDICFRAQQAGWKVSYLSTVPAVHYHGLSAGGRRSTWTLGQEKKSAAYFWHKHFPGQKLSLEIILMLYRIKLAYLDKKNRYIDLYGRAGKYASLGTSMIRHRIIFWLFRRIGRPIPMPLKVYYTISNKCNFRCQMCPHWQMQDDPGEYISPERMKQVIDQMADSGIREFGISGGEPLLRPQHTLDLLAYANSRGLYTHFVTNGSLLSEKILQEYNDAGGGHISISLDAIGEEHDRLRGFPGAYRQAEKALRMYDTEKYPRIRLKINTVLSDRNLDHMLEIVELAIERRAMIFIQPFDIYDYHGKTSIRQRQEKYPLWIQPDHQDRLSRLISKLKEYKKLYPNTILNDSRHLDAMPKYFLGQPYHMTCRYVSDQMLIDPFGKIFYCKFREVADLKEIDLKDFLFSDQRQSMIRASLQCRAGCLLGCQFQPSWGELIKNGPRLFYKLIK